MTAKEYFTPDERPQLLQLVRDLSDRLGSQLTARDINTVHRLIEQGITVAGIFRRDQYGLNPVLRHLHTALTLCDTIAPDRTMVIATMIYNLCRGDYLDVPRIKELFGDDIALQEAGRRGERELPQTAALVCRGRARDPHHDR